MSDALVPYVVDLEDLVRFLALPYGDNDPYFYPPLTEAQTRLANTWSHVVRGDAHRIQREVLVVTTQNATAAQIASEVPSETGEDNGKDD